MTSDVVENDTIESIDLNYPYVDPKLYSLGLLEVI